MGGVKTIHNRRSVQKGTRGAPAKGRTVDLGSIPRLATMCHIVVTQKRLQAKPIGTATNEELQL